MNGSNNATRMQGSKLGS